MRQLARSFEVDSYGMCFGIADISATAGGSERGLQWTYLHKMKRGIGAAGGSLHRLVRPFFIHNHSGGCPGSGMDIPPMIRQSFPFRSHACVIRRVCGAPMPSLSAHLKVTQ